MTNNEDEKLLAEELALLEAEVALKEGLPHLHGLPWFSWALDFFETRNRMAFLCAANQISKDLEDSTEIPTPTGFRKISDLKVGDTVFAQDGAQTKIIDIPYIGSGDGFRVIFSDGSSVVAGPNHEWVCKTSKERFRKTYKCNWERGDKREWANPSLGKWVTLTTREIISSGGYDPDAASNYRKISIPICDEVKTEAADLFDPYLLGLLLGDGCFRGKTCTITTKDQEIADFVISHGARRTADTITYRMPVGIRNEIKKLGLWDCLSNSKFIPEEYFLSCPEDRLALLRGLMDTDGTVNEKTTHTSFTTVSPRLARDVRTLICSLGGTVKTKKRKSGYRNASGDFVRCQDAYCLSIKIKQIPFRLTRKVNQHRGEIRYKHERVIERIEPVGTVKSRCITVEHPSGTFLATRDYVVTHNSSTQIRKVIHLATEQSLWPQLWPTPGLPPPNLFWYLYPSSQVATTEVQTKWMQFLPRGKYKDDKKYGWRAEYKNKEIHAIHFNSGVTIQFKSYKQGAFVLQSSTVYYVAMDEEVPIELFDELMLRVNATNGYISMVFTATLGQEEWRQVIECVGEPDEKFPQAWKRQVSAFDCMKYADGSPGPWTEERINQAIARCSTQAQVQRRILGKFIKESGLIYEQFDVKRHMKEWHPIPQSWLWYVAADIGSGKVDLRGQGHPGGVLVMAVKPDFTTARVVYCWRGDNMRTTAGDIYNKAEEIIKELNIQPSAKLYDWASADFGIIAARNGGGWKPANKSQTAGEEMVNTLFKHDMLFIYTKGQNGKLASELCSVNHETPKRKRKDDLCFVAGTLVSTDRGARPIEQIVEGDLVYTRAGLRPVVCTMKRRAAVKTYSFGCGESITCTPRHKFFTKERGFTEADDLTLSDTLVKLDGWQNQKSSSSTELNLGVTRILPEGISEIITSAPRITRRRAFAAFIKKFGSLFTEKFRQVTASIISMATPSTIESRILSACAYLSTCPSMQLSDTSKIQPRIETIWPRLRRRQRPGTLLTKECDGTGSTQRKSTRSVNQESTFARNARRLLGLRTIGAEIASAATGVARSSEQFAEVFNITVAEEHEYFVHGILVANCDPLRSICMEVAWDWTVIQGSRPSSVDAEESEAVMLAKLRPEQREAWHRAKEIKARRGESEEYERQEAEIGAEFAEINAMYEGT